MDILIYGNTREKELLIQHMKSEACTAFRLLKYSHAEDYDSYLKLLRLNTYDLIFVMADNAAGMEGVRYVSHSLSESYFRQGYGALDGELRYRTNPPGGAGHHGSQCVYA